MGANWADFGAVCYPGRRMLRQGRSAWAKRAYIIIFEADTPLGKAFDIALLLTIVLGLVAVSLESVASIREVYGGRLERIEWAVSLLFTVEYLLRLSCVRQPHKYALSFFGLVDLLSLLPTYLGLFFPGATPFSVIRTFRLLRVFRVLKLVRYVGEAEILWAAIRASIGKITIFIGVVLTLVVILGSVMYIVEGGLPESGFTSIPQSTYWAIVTMTTVGYGDVAPVSPLGKFIASIVMIVGYGVIAVPTGIVSVELKAATDKAVGLRRCPQCGSPRHAGAAAFCSACGAKLPFLTLRPAPPSAPS